MKHLATFMLFFIALSGCDSSTKDNITSDSVYDVNWYLSHPDEHRAQLDLCKSNPAKYDSTPNCINARSAAREKAMGYGKFNPNN